MRTASRPTLGIDSFTYHRYFGEVGEWEEPLPMRWSTVDFLDRAADLGVESVSLQTVFLEDLSPGGMRALREEVASRGLSSVLAWGHRSGLESGTSPARFDEAMICLDLATGTKPGVEPVSGSTVTAYSSHAARSSNLSAVIECTHTAPSSSTSPAVWRNACDRMTESLAGGATRNVSQ